MPCKQLFREKLERQFLESSHICYDDNDDECNFSNFIDADWLSSSGNSIEEEAFKRLFHDT